MPVPASGTRWRGEHRRQFGEMPNVCEDDPDGAAAGRGGAAPAGQCGSAPDMTPATTATSCISKRMDVMATYVLVPGCYQGGWIRPPVPDRRRAAGHTVDPAGRQGR